MKHSHFLKFGLLTTLLLSLLCCTNENEPIWWKIENKEIKNFFNVEELDTRSQDLTLSLNSLVTNTLLKQYKLIETIRNFKKLYGVPLWKHSIGITTANGYQLFVPIYNEKDKDEINIIWNFGIYNNRLYHFIAIRNTESKIIAEFWKYDYFTIYALRKKPKSGLSFEETESRSAWKCVIPIIIVGEGEDTYTSYKDPHCWEIDSSEFLTENSDPGNGSGNNGGNFDSGVPTEGESGNYNGGSGSSTQGGTAAPKAKAIFRNSNMTESNWIVIENMIDKIIENCMGQNLYNSLKEKLNGGTLSIQFTNKESSSFYFDGNTSGIKLSSLNVESNHLFHELFHAYQAYQETTETYRKSTINLEIEAHYAQYLYLKGLEEYPNSKWEKGYKSKQRLIGIANLEDYIDGHGRLLSNIPNDIFDLYLSMPLKEVFVKDNNYSNYSYDNSRYGTSNFQNLQNITINCGL